MPLYSSPAADAVLLRKANAEAFWGSRQALNRVEPLATPAFDLGVSLERGDTIFTVGSCFARNVEAKLAGAGFRIPMLELMRSRGFAGIDPTAINNFAAPSIRNELAWACGTEIYDPDQGVVEAEPGKWVDLHVSHRVMPVARATVLRRRAAITQAYRSFMDCRLIVVTLGLVEVWYDREHGIHLNRAPPPLLVERFPDRFEFQALDFAETLDACQKSIDLLRAHGRADATIVVSVSPVGMLATHRPQDVMVANCYTKSLLRVVAEHVVARNAGVEYFPGYESVTLSDRSRAWADDFVHVTDELVAHNVDRMVERLMGRTASDGGLDGIRAAIEAGGSAAAYRHAMEARKGHPGEARRFFAEFEGWSASSPMFATEHVEWLVDNKQNEKALEVASASGVTTERMLLAKVRALLRLRRYGEAAAILHDSSFLDSRSTRYWSLRAEAEGLRGDAAALEATLAAWGQAFPKRIWMARTHVARALLVASSPTRALELLGLVVVDRPAEPLSHLLAAEAHLALGDLTTARREYDAVQPTSTSDVKRHVRLRDRLGAAEGA